MSSHKRSRFQDYVILIIGGTTGIGLTTACEFIDNGASHVIVSGRSRWKWEWAKNKIFDRFKSEIIFEVADGFQLHTSTLEYIPCDVRIETSVKNLITTIINKYKYI